MSETRTMPPQHQPRQPGSETDMDPRPDWRPRHPGSGRLAGRVALVTGGDSGIGRAVCALFAREGARLGLVYLDETEDARETARIVAGEGSEALCVAGDVGDERFCRDAVRRVHARFGRLDVLVNNAAEQHPRAGLEEISADQLERTFRTNLFGYFHMTKAALEVMGEGAAIVNTTSVTAYKGKESLIDYSATKGAIVAFTRSMALSVVDRGIRVNGVAPGPVWTPLIPASFEAAEVETFGGGNPMGRPGQPNEIAPSHLFLACADSSFMTGQILHPNGGQIVGG